MDMADSRQLKDSVDKANQLNWTLYSAVQRKQTGGEQTEPTGRCVRHWG